MATASELAVTPQGCGPSVPPAANRDAFVFGLGFAQGIFEVSEDQIGMVLLGHTQPVTNLPGDAVGNLVRRRRGHDRPSRCFLRA